MRKYFIISRLSENMHETPEGFLVCLGVPIARTGPMEYAEGETPLEAGEDGIIEIDRTAEEVFRPQTIASFEGKAVTILHPNDFVSPQNWSQLAKGIVQNVRAGTGDQATDLIADLLITDYMAINLVKNGLREVSCGYQAEYTQTGKGKGIQTNIIGNHVALVDEGRAGSDYAIKDHKGVTMDKKTLLEKIKALVSDAFPDEKKPDEKKADDALPAAAAPAAAAPVGMDAVVKAIGDLSAMVSSMGKPAAADVDPAAAAPAGNPAPAQGAMEERLNKLEAAVNTILEKLSAKAGDDEIGDEEGGVIEDEDMEESEDAESDEDEDDKGEDESCTGDTASRVEILVPGMKASGKDIKAKALKACYATADGKKILEALNGGKAPSFDSKERVNLLFNAASELLKASRSRDLTKTRQVRDAELVDGTPNERVMTAEKMNELNAKHYSTRS